jgi:hypothetical protein
MAEIAPIRPLDEASALDWIRGQPGGRTNLPAAELGRRWGWHRQRAGRRLKAWAKAGLIRRRGDTITVADDAAVTPLKAEPVTRPGAARTRPVTPRARVTPGPVTLLAGITLAAALGLATVSAGFSITGLTNIFVGAFWPVIGMGIALEVGKLSAVAWLGRHQGTALKAALGVLVAVLMALNAVGAYGFLAQAHIAHAVAGEVTTVTRGAEVAARLSLQASVVADLDRRIAQIDGAVEQTTAKGRGASAMSLADSQRKVRGELVAQRTAAAKALAGLQVEKAKTEGDRRIIEADLGPVRYLAALLGTTDENVMRWFILVVALLLDPAAVLLLLAATSARR